MTTRNTNVQKWEKMNVSALAENFAFLSLFVLCGPSKVPTLTLERGPSLYSFHQMLIASRNTFTDTPEILYHLI